MADVGHDDASCARATYALGRRYDPALEDEPVPHLKVVTKYARRAKELYYAAAELGHAAAQHSLGSCYEDTTGPHGLGVASRQRKRTSFAVFFVTHPKRVEDDLDRHRRSK